MLLHKKGRPCELSCGIKLPTCKAAAPAADDLSTGELLPFLLSAPGVLLACICPQLPQHHAVHCWPLATAAGGRHWLLSSYLETNQTDGWDNPPLRIRLCHILLKFWYQSEQAKLYGMYSALTYVWMIQSAKFCAFIHNLQWNWFGYISVAQASGFQPVVLVQMKARKWELCKFSQKGEEREQSSSVTNLNLLCFLKCVFQYVHIAFSM